MDCINYIYNLLIRKPEPKFEKPAAYKNVNTSQFK